MIETIREELTRATELLAEAEIDTAQLDSEILMAYVLDKPRIHIVSHLDRRLQLEETDRFRELVERRVNREPLPYLTGTKEFWGLDFEVGPGVLVPRPETETLVDAALTELRGRKDPLVADIGAGSGCVVVALAVEAPEAVVYATELSHDAAEVARRNAVKHQVELRVDILEGNLFEPLPDELKGNLDAVVSNPPYIPSGEIEELQPEVSEHEPRTALDGGPDGMMYHRLILDAAREWLKPGGWVHMEMGMGQSKAVSAYALDKGYKQVRVTKDLAGIDRVVSCSL
jgi:release factor glutamine methyltransferase